MNDDESLIKRLGGAAKLAELLGYGKAGGVQRVHNWCKRGIPARIKLERPDLFMQPSPTTQAAPAAHQLETRHAA